MEQVLVSAMTGRRLLAACALGGAIGLEREWRHKDSGLRTNMLICLGSALFTVMSTVLAGGAQDSSRVAANIVQGVGFLGAGLIMHAKSRIVGLTSAATVFTVAAIGMTCGAGLYLEALTATVIVLVALAVIGSAEVSLGWKRFPMLYEVRANVEQTRGGAALAMTAEQLIEETETARHRMYTAILKVLDEAGQRLDVLDRGNLAGLERVSFWVIATRKEHANMLHKLRMSDATDQVVTFQDVEES